MRSEAFYTSARATIIPPDTRLSDSIVAMDLKSGDIRWSYQATETTRGTPAASWPA